MKTTIMVLSLATLALGACVKERVIDGPGSGAGSTVAPLVVDQFMRAANQQPPNLQGMGKLFGTKDGSAWDKWPRYEVETRMFAIARELKHQDFQVTAEQIVPGRTGEATQLTVRVKINERNYNVPFTLVRYKENNWLIEQIGIDVITRSQR